MKRGQDPFVGLLERNRFPLAKERVADRQSTGGKGREAWGCGMDRSSSRNRVQSCFQAFPRVGGKRGREHQNRKIGVGKLTYDPLLGKTRGKLVAGVSKGLGGERDFQRLVSDQREAARTNPFCKAFRCLHIGSQCFGKSVGKVGVYGVERLQDQIGRAGGAKKREGTFGLFRHPCGRGGAQVQVGGSRQRGERFVRRIAAQVGAKVERMLGGGQKFEIRPVRVVHQKQDPVAVAKRGDRRQIGAVAEVIGRGEIDRRYVAALEPLLQMLHVDGTGKIGGLLGRRDPFGLKIQKRRRREKGLVYVARGQNMKGFALPYGIGLGQIEHGADAVGGALGAIQGGGRAEEAGGVFLAFANDAIRLVQAVRTLDLGEVIKLRAEQGCALVPRHVQPQRVFLTVPTDKLADRGVHSFPSPSRRETSAMMAHSMRLRKSLQPYSYTPRTEPVEW